MAPSSTGSEFGYPQWTMREPQQQQQMTAASAARKPVQKTHSIDRLSMSSQELRMMVPIQWLDLAFWLL